MKSAKDTGWRERKPAAAMIDRAGKRDEDGSPGPSGFAMSHSEPDTSHPIAISHPDKPYWPEDGWTKTDMIEYYRRIGPVMLPYFRDRPVTLRLFPRGIHGPSFYRRELPASAPSWLRSVPYQTRSHPHSINLPLVDDLDGLIYLANLGSIEFHLWASRAPQLDRPDWAVFDLDPGDRVDFPAVLEAALLLHEELGQRGLEGYPKTSGASGLHVYVPVQEYADFDALRDWVHELTRELADRHPKLIQLPRRETHSGRLVSIDYRQNSIGRNTAAPYTLRALPGAPVSTPLDWEEVKQGKFRPTDFTLEALPKRIEQKGDLFAPLLKTLADRP